MDSGLEEDMTEVNDGLRRWLGLGKEEEETSEALSLVTIENLRAPARLKTDGVGVQENTGDKSQRV